MSRRKRFTRNLNRKLRSPLPIRTTVEWIRFEHEHEPYGVFSYLKEAREVLSAEVRGGWLGHSVAVPQPRSKAGHFVPATAGSNSVGLGLRPRGVTAQLRLLARDCVGRPENSVAVRQAPCWGTAALCPSHPPTCGG